MATPTRKVLLMAGIATVLAAWINRMRKQGDGTAEGAPTREEDGDPIVPPPSSSGVKGKPKPLAVGLRTDPEIVELLADMEAQFAAAGINTDWFSPLELTVMRKTPNRSVAIPQRSMWPSLIYTIVEIAQPLRAELGIPFRVIGYRPADYNVAVGGAPNSRHIYGQAVDLYLVGDQNTSANRRKLALAAARIWVNRGRGLKMGFGAYSAPTPSNVHVDTGYSYRKWREAKHYIDQVKAVS